MTDDLMLTAMDIHECLDLITAMIEQGEYAQALVACDALDHHLTNLRRLSGILQADLRGLVYAALA